MKRGNFLVLSLVAAMAAGCGSVSPAGTGVEEAAGSGGTAAGEAGAAGGGSAGSGAAAAAGAPGACAPPALAVAWTIVDLATGRPLTCEEAGTPSIGVRLTAFPGTPSGSGLPLFAALPCAPGAGAVSLAALAKGMLTFSYDIDTQAAAGGLMAWARPTRAGISATRAGTYDGAGCGAVSSSEQGPFQIVVGTSP